jgi:hypothetical protein
LSDRWTTFCEVHETRRAWAHAAAAQIRAGDLDNPAFSLARRWGVPSCPEPITVALARFATDGPEGMRGSGLYRQSMTDHPYPPSDVLGRSDLGVVHWLQKQASEQDLDFLPFALYHVDLLAEDVTRVEGQAWSTPDFAGTPVRSDPQDAATAQAFRWWNSGEKWKVKRLWEELFLEGAVRAMRGVLASARVPADRQSHVLNEARGAFFFLMENSRIPIPGWVAVATRVLESGPDGGWTELTRLFLPQHHRWTAACLAQRGRRAYTTRALFPDLPYVVSRAERLEHHLLETPCFLAGFESAHVMLRLMEAWKAGQALDAGSQRDLGLQSTKKLRARLRALVGQEINLSPPVPSLRGALVHRLESMPSLYERTAWAVRATMRSWIFDELRLGLPVDISRPLLAPCEPVRLDEPRAATQDEWQMLKSWITLVALRGRLEHLVGWAGSGGTGVNDAVWNRLLADELPDGLCGESAGRDRYHRARYLLSEHLEPLLHEVRPHLTAVASLQDLLDSSSGRRHLPQRAREVLSEGWHPSVSLPGGGYPAAVRNAARSLSLWGPGVDAD